MDLFSTIKVQTKTHHQNVEKVLVAEFKALKNLEEYATLLKRLYQFYYPLENELQKLIKKSDIPDIKKRQHHFRLLQDINVIDNSFDKIPTKKNIEIKNLSYAFGVLYVIEGSTLGGQIITKMLVKQLQTNQNVTSYFYSYGNETQDMWSSYKKSVLALENKIDSQEMINGAKDTFDSLREWLLISSESLESKV